MTNPRTAERDASGPPPRGDGARATSTPGTSPAEVQQRLAYDRTYLANERTYAAWLRTGLAIAAGGIAVAHAVPEPSRDSLLALALGTLLVLTGVGVMGYGARQFIRTAQALTRESGRAAPAPIRVPYVLTGIVGVMLLAVLLFLWSHQGRARAAAEPAVGAHAGSARRPGRPRRARLEPEAPAVGSGHGEQVAVDPAWVSSRVRGPGTPARLKFC